MKTVDTKKRIEGLVEPIDKVGLEKVECLIEGRLKTAEGTEIGWSDLKVHAYVAGEEVARSEVDDRGQYKLVFPFGKVPPATELRVVPKKIADRDARTFSLGKTIGEQRFAEMKVAGKAGFIAKYDVMVPIDYLKMAWSLKKTYRMHGAVYATTFQDVGGVPTAMAIEPLPAARIEFYEVDLPWIILFGSEWKPTEGLLGSTMTGPDGAYEFTFDFTSKTSPWLWAYLFADKVPDVRVRVSQFQDGTWTQVYEGPVDWNIVEDFHRDYFVPIEATYPVPPLSVKPATGFRFTSLGLLPIDDTRLVNGYATAQPGDPANIAGVSHQPFCGRLRLFGLFADLPTVETYQVEIADADELGAVGTWKPVLDPLTNRKWDTAQSKWLPMLLGPDPMTGRYQNIDTEPEADWHEHALKVTWQSVNEPNGYYAIRITGYDAAGNPVGVHEMPVIRTDNTKPDASIDAVGTAVGGVSDCGHLTVAASDRWIRFRLTAHDTEGHVRKYWVSGSRGKDAVTAGPTVSELRPDPDASWIGRQNYLDEFPVDPLPTALSSCTSVAYNFELHVHGLATDGYVVTPGSQRVKKEVNLVVAES